MQLCKTKIFVSLFIILLYLNERTIRFRTHFLYETNLIYTKNYIYVTIHHHLHTLKYCNKNMENVKISLM